jgi:hypothetical protein
MLLHLNSDVRACYINAKTCARKAAAQPDADVRQSFLDAQERWLRLAKQLAQVLGSKPISLSDDF